MIDKEAKEFYERIAQVLERIADALDKMTQVPVMTTPYRPSPNDIRPGSYFVQPDDNGEAPPE